MKMSQHLNFCSRIFTFIMAFAVLFSISVSTAFAATAAPSDSYIAINKVGDSTKFYGGYEEEAPELTLEVGATYHVEVCWKYAPEDNAEVAKGVNLWATMINRIYLAGDSGEITVSVGAENLDESAMFLSFQAGGDLVIVPNLDSYQIFSDAFPNGSKQDALGFPVNGDYSLYMGDLASGHICRLEFDFTVDPWAPSEGNESSAGQDVFNVDGQQHTFSICEVGSNSDATFSEDVSSDHPVVLDPDKNYELWASWQYNQQATAEVSGIGFNFQAPTTVRKGQTYCAFSIYAADKARAYTSDSLQIWHTASADLELQVLTDTIKIWSDGELKDGSAPPLPAESYNVSNWLWDVPLGYNSLGGTFAAGDTCYVSFQISTKATNLPEVEQNHSDGTTEPSDNADSSTAPSEPVETYDPTLPKVFKGVVDSSNRELFKEDARPEYAVFNSVTDNPDYGDETKFLTITDLTKNKTYREGTVTLVPGRQYQVQVFYRNDSTYEKGYLFNTSRTAEGAYLYVDMPYEIAPGSIAYMNATISAENTLPLTVSAGLNLTSDYGISLEYMDGSASHQRNGGDDIEAVDYEYLFRDGVSLGDVKSQVFGTITFTIRAVADDSIVAAELPNDGANGPSGSGFWSKVSLPTVVVSLLLSAILYVVARLVEIVVTKRRAATELTAAAEEAGQPASDQATTALDTRHDAAAPDAPQSPSDGQDPPTT